MSDLFDEVVEASWTRFEESLTGRIRRLRSRTLEIQPAEKVEGQLPLVTIERDGQRLVAELVAMGSDDGFEAAAALGWAPPEAPEETPCWGASIPSDEVELLVGMVSGALRYVYGVADPAFLAGEKPRARKPIPPRPGRHTEPGVVLAFPSSSEELASLIEQALDPQYGPDVVRDDDGDFPISAGAVPLWVQVHPDAPIVRLFSIVVGSVRDARQARTEVGILNRRTPLLKFTFDHATITAIYDLPAAPFVGGQLTATIDRVTELLNELAADTADRVCGKLWFEGVAEAPSRHEDSA